MNIEFLVISLLLVMLVFLPFYIIPFLQSKGSKSLQKKFREEAAKLNLNTDINESWNQNITGIDSAHKKLLFVQKLEDQIVVQNIDLNKVKQSKLIVTRKQKKNGGRIEDILEKIELEFLPLYGDATKSLCLYDHDLIYHQDLELINAEKVNEHINKLLTSRGTLQRTA